MCVCVCVRACVCVCVCVCVSACLQDFDRRFVAAQLAGLGLGQAAAARRLGLPIVLPAPAFYETHRRLLPILRPLAPRPAGADPTAARVAASQAREACRCLLTVLKIPAGGWEVGDRYVHLSTGAAAALHGRQHHLARVLVRRALRDSGWVTPRIHDMPPCCS